MSATSLRQIFIYGVLVLVSTLGTASFILYLYRAELFDMPGLAPVDWRSTMQGEWQEDIPNDRDALRMQWADNLVKAKPYSADVATEIVEVLGDGNRIHRHIASRFYRDKAGRMRLEVVPTTVYAEASVKARPHLLIDDPVLNKSYVLSEGNSSTEYGSARQPDFLRDFGRSKGMALLSLPRLDAGRDIQQRALGVKEISGVNCRGMEEEITIPSGAIGNERPIVIQAEVWYAPAIDGVVESLLKDPRFGTIDYRVSNIKLGEQPEELFRSPIKRASWQTAK